MIDPSGHQKDKACGDQGTDVLDSLSGSMLARTEWIKLYGAMLDKEEEAYSFFDEQ